MNNTPVSLREVLAARKRAVHIGGRHFLDGPNVVRRFVTVEVEANYGIDAEERAFSVDVQRKAEPGAKFPRDGWILLEE